MSPYLLIVVSKFRGLLPKSRFARSVSVLAGGTIVGQAVIILGSPILTRLYSPEDFGVLAVFASLLGILGVISSLRYQLAIPLPESDAEAANVAVLSLFVVFGVTLLTAIIAIPLREPIAEFVNAPALADYIWFLPLGLLLVGIYQVLYYWAIRTKAFPAIARTKLTQSAGMVAVQIIGYALGPLALLLGRVFGQAAGTTTLGFLAYSNGGQAFRGVRPSRIREMSARYYQFPLYSSWAGLLNTGGTQSPPILFSIFYGASAAGLYMLAHRVIALPMTLLGTAIADVFMPNAVEAVREDRLKDSVASLQRQLARIALPPAAIVFTVAPDVFHIIFGPNWEEAGQMVRWLTPMLFLQFVASPLSRIFVALERQKLGLVLQANLFVLRIGSLLVAGFLTIGFLDAVIWYGIASGIGYFAYVVAIAMVTGNSMTKFVGGWASCVPWLLLVVAPVLVACHLGGEGVGWIETVSFVFSLTLLLCYYGFYFSRGKLSYESIVNKKRDR